MRITGVGAEADKSRRKVNAFHELVGCSPDAARASIERARDLLKKIDAISEVSGDAIGISIRMHVTNALYALDHAESYSNIRTDDLEAKLHDLLGAYADDIVQAYSPKKD